jgi:predicted phosphodiesterase
MRIGFLSDLHIDFNIEIMEYVIDVILRMKYANKIDKLFLGGDISNDYLVSLEFTEETDSYPIFGNHEYWFTEEKVKKMIKIIDI